MSIAGRRFAGEIESVYSEREMVMECFEDEVGVVVEFG